MSGLTHLDEHGAARMVDVGAKPESQRRAVAEGRIRMSGQALAALRDGTGPKGDALATARIAGIMAAKKTADLIPLCHPIALTQLTIDFDDLDDGIGLSVTSTARSMGRTGDEMEALTGASIAALTVYDMCKAVDRAIRIDGLRLLRKSGGKSGDWQV